jgi:hypothetical protein
MRPERKLSAGATRSYPGVNQDAEVTKLLGYLVQQHRDRSGPSGGGRDHECTRNYGSVEKVVDPISHEVRYRHGMDHLLMWQVSVMPVEDLLEYQERKDPGQHPGGARRVKSPRTVGALGHEMEKNIAQ